MFIIKLTTNGMTIWGSKMGEKLKQGYFRVTPYNEPRPLSGDWYLVENDNNFSVVNDGISRGTYAGFSHGCGTVMSAFMTEYFVYESGAGQVKIMDKDYNNHMLITIPINEIYSVLCMNNFIFVAYLNNNVLTVSKYIIVGTKYDPFYEVIDTKTIDVSVATIRHSACVVKNETEGFLYQGESSGFYESVKIEIDGNDFNLSIVNNSIVSQLHPNMVLIANNDRFLYYKPLSYYSDCPNLLPGTGSQSSTNWTFSVYNSEDVLQYSYTISRTRAVARPQGAKVFLNQNDGSGYLVVFDCFNNSGGQPCGRIRLLSFGGGNITEIYSEDTETISLITGSIYQNACCPWKGIFPGFGYGQNQYISRKAEITLSSCSFATAQNFTNTSTPMRFGNTIKWL